MLLRSHLSAGRRKERIRKKVHRTRDLARADIFEYIEMSYNRARRHSHLGGVSPEAIEAVSNRIGEQDRGQVS
jgi:putative transposase